MVSHWPWHRIEVCPTCEPAFDAEFRRRLCLLAPEAVAQDADVVARVCLMCGTQHPWVGYTPSARWVDAAGTPVGGRFHVCDDCRGKLLANGIVSAAELHTADDFRKVLANLPEVADDLVQRTEGWSLTEGPGPAGSDEVRRGLTPEAAAEETAGFWAAPPPVVTEAAGPPLRRGALLRPEATAAIRTHLELRWQAGEGRDTPTAALAIYRTPGAFTLVRYPQ